MICCPLEINTMQYEKTNQQIFNDIHCVEESSVSQIIYRHYVCDKCCKRRDSNQHKFNETCVQDCNQNLASDLVKPCSVFIRRLDLLGHNGNTSSCCLTFPEMSLSEELEANKKIDITEHRNSVAENKIKNLSKRNMGSVRKRMDLLFESLCETLYLIRAGKKKYKETKKEDCNVFASGISGNVGIKNVSKVLTGNLHQEKNQINKSSKISKPYAKNSSRNYKISCVPKLKNITKKIHEKENTSSNNSYEGIDNENEAQSEIDIKKMQIKYLSSSEINTNHRARVCEISELDSDLFVDRRNNFSVPRTCSTTKIFSRFPAKSNQDKTLPAHDLPFSLNNSNPKTKDIEKVENTSDKKSEVEIETIKHIVQKNLKGNTENYSVDKDVKFINENSVYYSNHNIKSIQKAEISVENCESEIQILEEYIVTRNFEKTKKCPIDMNENSCGSENKEYLKDNGVRNKQILDVVKPCFVLIKRMDKKMINLFCNSTQTAERGESMGNKQILNKVVIKPSFVLIERMDKKMINLFCNGTQTAEGDEANNCIPQMETVNQCRTDSCSLSGVFNSSATIDKISNRSPVRKLTASNEQAFNFSQRLPWFKPCVVVIPKLPVDKHLKVRNPAVINSFGEEKTSDSNMMDETDSYISEAKTVSRCKMNFSLPDSSVFSSIVNEIPNADTVLNLGVTNEQNIKETGKTALIKPCHVVVQKCTHDKKLLVKKSSLKRQHNFLKFKRKNYLMAFKSTRSGFLENKSTLINRCILNEMCAKKLDKPSVCKKWKRKPFILKQTVEECRKCLQLKGDLSVHNCINFDKVSSTLLKENQHFCHTSSDISPKCFSGNFRANNCHVRFKKKFKDLYVNNCKNINKVLSRILRENQYICNETSGVFCMCPTSNLVTNRCFVLLERINVDKYLVENKNQHGLKCSTSSDLVLNCPISNYKIHDCSVLLERINLDEYFSKNKVYQYDLRDQSKNLIKSPDGGNRYKIGKNSVRNSRFKLKRKNPLREEDILKLDAKKLKRIPDHHDLEKTVNNFVTADNHINFICDSNYKCVQCRESICTDFELYHHLCCGKRKKGYICDFCEKIFETIPMHKKHLNYHYQFIS